MERGSDASVVWRVTVAQCPVEFVQPISPFLYFTTHISDRFIPEKSFGRSHGFVLETHPVRSYPYDFSEWKVPCL
jgi:hypothetical protein